MPSNANCSSTSLDPSVEPSSTTTRSPAGSVWARTLSMARPMKRSWLYEGMTTDRTARDRGQLEARPVPRVGPGGVPDASRTPVSDLTAPTRAPRSATRRSHEFASENARIAEAASSGRRDRSRLATARAKSALSSTSSTPGIPASGSSFGATTGSPIATNSYTFSGLVAWVTSPCVHGMKARSACAR